MESLRRMPKNFRPRAEIFVDLESAIDQCDADALGRALHAFQDSFSHDGFSCWGLGHVPHSAAMWVLRRRDTDSFHPEDSGRDQMMQVLTQGWLEEWQARCGSACEE
jgi:hypothetical protein